jgi:hypothetical protein
MTGSYWMALAVTLHTPGYAASVVNPSRAHYFAKARLHRAKTNPLDAQNLARLAAALQPDRWTHPPAVYHDATKSTLWIIQAGEGVRAAVRDDNAPDGAPTGAFVTLVRQLLGAIRPFGGRTVSRPARCLPGNIQVLRV